MSTIIKESKLTKEIYRLVDSFLTESKNQDGKERSLEQLNRDRHLFVNNMEISIKLNIGMLRQWLNEDRITDKKMVTNEELEQILFM